MTDEPEDGFAAAVELMRGLDPRAEDRAFWAEMDRQGRIWRPRRKGRPRGVYSVTRDQLLEAYRRLRDEIDRRPKQRELGLRLHASDRQIRTWLTAYKLPWPPE